MKLIMNVVLALALCWVKCSHQVEMNENTLAFCGRKLAEARAVLCFGVQLVKKSDKYSYSGNLIGNDVAEYPQQWPWVGRQTALGAQWGRNKRGNTLVEECCLKPCTANEILNYC